MNKNRQVAGLYGSHISNNVLNSILAGSVFLGACAGFSYAKEWFIGNIVYNNEGVFLVNQSGEPIALSGIPTEDGCEYTIDNDEGLALQRRDTHTRAIPSYGGINTVILENNPYLNPKLVIRTDAECVNSLNAEEALKTDISPVEFAENGVSN